LPSAQGLDGLVQSAKDRFAGNYHRNGEQARIDGLSKKVQAIGVTPDQFTALVGSYLKEKGIERVANGSSSYAGRALADAQEFVADLVTYDDRFRKPNGIRVLFHSWAVNNPGLSEPSASQLLGHAAKMIEGKVKFLVAFQDGQFVVKEAANTTGAKPELTFKKFLVRKYSTDMLVIIQTRTGKTESILRQEYQQFLTKGQ
jgi:hypothetical protein